MNTPLRYDDPPNGVCGAARFGWKLLLFAYATTVCSRSSPRNVTLSLPWKQTISVYKPFLIKIVRGLVLFAGTESTAPCTVAKSPVPSAATVSRTASAGGADGFVEKTHVVFPASPAKGAPPTLTTPGSICT